MATTAKIKSATIASISTDSGSSSTDFITNDNTLTLSGQVSGTGTLDVFLVDSLGTVTLVGKLTISASGTWSINTQTLADGTYTIRLVDDTTSGVLATQTLVVDNSAPTAVATITALSADSGGSTTDFTTDIAAQTVSGAYTGTLATGETIQVSTNGTTWINATLSSGNNWSASGVTLAAGTGNLQVRTIDLAGNATAGTPHSYTLDTTAPAAVATVTALGTDTGSSATDFVTNTASQTVSGTFNGTLGAGETIQVSTNGTTWANATTSFGNNWSASGVTLAAGTGTLQVRTVDLAGNATAGTSHSYTLDTTAPTAVATITALSADSGSSTTDFNTSFAAQTVSGTYSGTLGAGETIQVSTDSGATWISATASKGNWSATGVTLASGTGTLQVRTVDTAGNFTTGTSHSYTLDTAAPTAVATIMALSADNGSSATDFLTNVAAQTVTGTYSGTLGVGETIQVSTNGTTWINATLSSGNNWSASGVTLAAGTGTLQVRTVDLAGNATTGTGHGYTLDTNPPTAAATVTALSADVGSSTTDFITNIAAQTVSGTYTGTLGGGDTIQVGINGANWVTATISSGTWSASGVTLAAGTGTLQVRTVDAAGNAVAGTGHSYTLDTTAPTSVATVTALSADSGTSTSDFTTNVTAQTVSGTFTGTLGTGETIQVSANGTTWITATTTNKGTWTAGVTLAAGTGTLLAQTIDAAGNAAAGTGHSYTLDTAAPTAVATVIALSNDNGSSSIDFITSIATQTVSGTYSGTLAADETIQASTNGTNWINASASAGSWSAPVTLATGTGTLQVRTIDLAGNVAAGTGHSYTLDTSAPAAVATITALGADTGNSAIDFITNVANQTVSGTYTSNLAAGELIQISLDGTTWVNATILPAKTWSASVTLVDGPGTLQVRTIDSVDHSTAGVGHAYTLDTTAPTITISPIAGDNIINASEAANAAGVTISGTATDGSGSGINGQTATINILDASSTVVDSFTTAVAGGVWSINLTAAQAQALADGAYSVTATVSDIAGNAATPATQALTLDQDLTETVSLIVAGSPIGLLAATAVSYTVVGLESDDSGTVTFTDGAKIVSAPVTPGGNGTFTIDLSSLTDGPITSSLSITDPGGNQFSAAGNTGMLDRDVNEQAALSLAVTKSTIDSTGTASFQLVVGGLEADDSGTVTLTDGSNPGSVSVAAGQANYTANLSPLVDGTVTSHLSVTDTAGNTFGFTGNSPFAISGVNFDGSNINIDNGIIEAISGTLDLAAPLSGTGSLQIDNNATLELAGAGAESVTFADGNDTLQLDNALGFAGTIAGVSSGEGTFTITGPGSITTSSGDALDFTASGGNSGNPANVVLTPSGAVTGAAAGLVVTQSGVGDLTVNATGPVAGQFGNGILVQDSASGSGNISVTAIGGASASGTTTATINLVPNTTQGFAAIRAQNLDSSNTGDVSVTASGALNGTQYGIRAQTNGSGHISVTTDAATSINSGGAGISVVNLATAIAASASSSITVTTYGTVTSGTVLNPSGSAPKGVDAGYFGANGTANLNINGTVLVNNYANVTATAPGSTGVNAYTYGNGNVTLNEGSGTTVTGVSIGIGAFSLGGGVGTIALNVGANATITSTANDAIEAYSLHDGSISVTTSAGDTINAVRYGILAFDQNQTVAAGHDITVVAAAGTTIHSSGSAGFGIQAGYSPVPTPSFVEANVHGNVDVTSSAVITTIANGINAVNWGTGNVTVTTGAASQITSSGTTSSGINVFTGGGGNVVVSNAGKASGATGINATTNANLLNAGTVSITNNGIITGTNGAGINANSNDGGSLSVINTGTATGSGQGINANVAANSLAAGALSVSNSGTASGTTAAGIRAFDLAGGDVSVTNSGATTGTVGINASSSGAGRITIDNNGQATGTSGQGINANASGTGNVTVTTGAGSSITTIGIAGGVFGVNAQTSQNGAVTVANDGSINVTGGGGGIYAIANGLGNVTVTAGVDSMITASNNGIQAEAHNGGNVSVTNAGQITDGNFGITTSSTNSGTVTVNNSGTISSTRFEGIWVVQNSAGATGSTIITNEGTVVGGPNGAGAASITVNGNSTGTVTITNTGTIGSLAKVMDIAINDYAGAISIDNKGTIYGGLNVNVGNGTFINEAGSTWQVGTTGQVFSWNVLNPAVTNNGTIEVMGSKLYVSQGLSDSGTIKIDAGASLSLQGALSGSGSIEISDGATLQLHDTQNFAGAVIVGGGGTLELFGTQDFANTVGQIEGLTAGNYLDLEDLAFDDQSSQSLFNSGVLTVTEGNTTLHIARTAPTGVTYQANSFVASVDPLNGNGTRLTFQA